MSLEFVQLGLEGSEESFIVKMLKQISVRGYRGVHIGMPEIILTYGSLTVKVLFLRTISNALTRTSIWQRGQPFVLSSCRGMVMIESVALVSIMLVCIDNALHVKSLAPGGASIPPEISIR